MNKKFILYPLAALTFLFLSACGNDDGANNVEPPRDRGEEALAGQLEIEEFLTSHFYNYEAFANPPADFDFKIVLDTISGDNLDKIPLINQVAFKTVQDRFDSDVTYKLYYLIAQQGSGESPSFPDIATATYEAYYTDRTLFDGSPTPVKFDLTAVINGFQDILIEFNGAGTIIDNPDGSISYEDFGVGAAFIPSGLGYFNNPPLSSTIPVYAQLIFTFQAIDAEVGDQDNDGIPSVMEDLNMNGFEEDDDTDEDGADNYFDSDDDNDGRLTRDEIEIDSEGNITFPDVDGDGTPDYLDADS
jgi:hypothetical protein